MVVKKQDYSIQYWASSIGTWAARNAGQPNRAAVLSYGAEIILGSVVKLSLLALLSFLLRIPHIVAVMILTAGSFRLLSGGAHCTAYCRCLAFSLLVFGGIGLSLKFILPYLMKVEREFLIIPLFLCLIWTLKWAPLPPQNKPLRDENDRLMRKFLSVMFCSLVWCFMYIKGTGNWWVWACVGGLLLQSFTLTPIGIKLLRIFDTILTLLQRKEVEFHGQNAGHFL